MTDNNSYIASSLSFSPSGWMETTLGEVSEVQTGKNIPTSQQLSKGKYEIIGANGLIGYTDNFLLDGEYILTGRVGTIGEINYKKGKFYPSDNVIFIKSNKDNSNKFLFYLLKTKQLKLLNVGSTQPLIKQSDIKNFPILLPPLPEQQAIASVLSAFDDKIELLREQNKTLEEMGQTIFGEWFGKYGVDDELPEGWRVGKLGEELVIKQGKYIESENLSENQTEDKKYTIYGGGGIRGYTKDFMYEKPMVVLTCRGNGCGLIQFSKEKSSITNSCMAFENMSSPLSSEFIYLLSKKIDFESVTSGSAQPQITVANLYNMEIIIPDQKILKQFDEAIQPIFGKIRDNEIQIQSLAHSRDELLPRLMRGEVRVKF